MADIYNVYYYYNIRYIINLNKSNIQNYKKSEEKLLLLPAQGDINTIIKNTITKCKKITVTMVFFNVYRCDYDGYSRGYTEF